MMPSFTIGIRTEKSPALTALSASKRVANIGSPLPSLLPLLFEKTARLFWALCFEVGLFFAVLSIELVATANPPCYVFKVTDRPDLNIRSFD
jgi:hypothetical protein